ncbi:MAG TPA: ABC transporter permease [Chthoniobacterales bacterium]|jgi:putative ABC transport system permease protein|nr:ABC transporter permease [Chthoniobacterales bacterium]
MLNDLRYGLRQLIKHPGFTIVATLTLALAIGATTALFSLIKGAYLEALPYPRAHDIVTMSAQFSKAGEMPFSGPEFVALKERTHALENISALMGGSFNLSGEGDAVRFRGLRATASLFRMLEVRPILGRVFTDDEQTPGNDRVALISYQLWQRALAGAANVVGRQLRLNDVDYTIIGVMPPRFRYGDNDIWVPLSLDLARQDRAARDIYVHARLAPNESLSKAKAELATVAEQIKKDFGGAASDYAGWSIEVTPLIDDVVRDVKSALGILLGAVGCILLIACANISNLQLARNVMREREMAVRLALGARRLDLIRQLLTESGLLAVFGGMLGIFFASWSLGPLLALIPYSYIPIEAEVKIDYGVLLAAVAVTFVTALIVGLMPALKASRPDLNNSLKDGRSAAGSALKHRRAQSLLVVSQVSLAFVLLISCALMLKSFARLQRIDPGFDPTQLMKFETALPVARYATAPDAQRFYENLRASLENIPGVRSVGAVTILPLAQFPSRSQFSIDGRAQDPSAPLAEQRQITPGYLSTLGISLVEGRDLSERDNTSSLPVALVNQAFVEKYFPNIDPIGRRIRLAQNGNQNPWLTIVGVTKDVRQLRMTDPILPEIYRAHSQAPDASRRMAFVIRSATSLTSLTSAVRESVRAQDAAVPIFEVEPVRELIERSFGGQKLVVFLLGMFGALALLLTIIGIYGVTAYFVAHRTNEIGIRIALGAQRHNILTLVLGQGARMVGAGVTVGLIAAVAATRILRAMLFEVSATDLFSYALVTVSLAATAILACYFPARSAMNLNPLEALRSE